MNIWLDLRFLNIDDLYSQFVIELVQNLITNDEWNKFNVYLNMNIPFKGKSNLNLKQVNINVWSIKEQTSLNKIFKEDKNALMIFFDYNKPIFYKWDYYLFISSLKNVYYQNFTKHSEKFKFLYILWNSIKKATKIICLDENTKDELIERFNVKETKLNVISWFFPWLLKLEKTRDTEINLLTINNIVNPYFIYSCWNWIEKNLNRLVKAFSIINKWDTNYDLVFLWDEISKDINLRNLVIKYNLQKSVFFVSTWTLSERKFFYENALWVIFPSLYEPFPFSLNETIFFQVPIISSNINSLKKVLWNKANYFSPISTTTLVSSINSFLTKKNNVNYSSLLKEYNIDNTTNMLINLIKHI